MTTSEHLLFLTGKLAKPGLEKVMAEIQPDFTYTIHELGLSVAALMTTELIMRRLNNIAGATRIILPGRFRGDLEKLSKHFKVPVERGPDELKDLPLFFGQEKAPPDLSHYTIKIFGEIVNAPEMKVDDILRCAETYRKDGADIIDLGFLPDTLFPHLEETIILLKEHGFEVSIDTHDPDILIQAAQWGADYLFSLSEKTLWVAEEVDAIPILVPNTPHDIESLYRCIEIAMQKGFKFIADPILDPIHCGFTDSILRYHQVRQRYPTAEILMGIGNLTELTHADTAGTNAILLGIASELNINHVLATQVSEHCRTAIREADLARRMLFIAQQENRPPTSIDTGLMALHERKPFRYNDDEIATWAKQVKDRNFRIQVNDSGIHIYNRSSYRIVTDPFKAYPKLDVSADGGHAFYLGVELGRAQIAWQLGKYYNQDEELKWGCATEQAEEDLTRFKEWGETFQKAGAKK